MQGQYVEAQVSDQEKHAWSGWFNSQTHRRGTFIRSGKCFLHTFAGRSSAVFLQRHCCVSVLQQTLPDGQKEREATRGVDMQLQEALIQREAQQEAHIRCYVIAKMSIHAMVRREARARTNSRALNYIRKKPHMCFWEAPASVVLPQGGIRHLSRAFRVLQV